LGAGITFATTNGRLIGTVADNQDVALPGVTVIISSDALIGGQQTAITDGEGKFAFNLLPPGTYHVRTDLPGFSPSEVDVKVNLDRTTSIRVPMVMTEFADEIEVVAEAPVVDTSQVDTGQVFDQDFLAKAAIGSGGRGYQSITMMAAGSTNSEDSGNASVYGSLGSENAYLVDGLNTTDPVTATFGTNFNYDAIQEVNFLTGGFEAEYGQATGGIVNLVTKSGGNEFSGTLDIRYRDSSFLESGEHYDPDTTETERRQISATLGGPVIRDKLWFFVSAENIDSKYTPSYSVLGFQPATYNYKGWNYIGKMTWQVSNSHRAIFKFSGDPAEIDNAISAWYAYPEAERLQKQGGDIYQAELNSVLSDAVLLTAQIGANRQQLSSEPMSGDIDEPGYIDAWTGAYFHNYLNYQDSDRDRDEGRLHVSYFLDDVLGSHEWKAGVEYNNTEFASQNFTPGGRYFRSGSYYGPEDEGWDPECATDPNACTFFWYDGNHDGINDVDIDGDGYVDYDMVVFTPEETQRDWRLSEGDFLVYFLQDAWRPAANLTIKPGIRYDDVDFTNPSNEQLADFGRWQPRFGVAWDVFKTGKTVARGSWGRFMHPTALGMADNYPGIREGADIYYGLEYYCWRGNGAQLACDPDILQLIYGEPYVWVDEDGDEHLYYYNEDESYFMNVPTRTVEQLGITDLEAPYADELIIGIEQQIMRNTSIEISYVDKKTRSMFGDTCDANTFLWDDSVDPPSFDDPESWTDISECAGGQYVVANIDMARRDYEAYILKFESRERDWFHLLASYTYSESKGSTSEDPAGGFDEPLWDVFPLTYYNKYGYMPDHRKHRIKVNGYLILPMDFTVGIDGWYSSHEVYDVYANCDNVLAASPEQLEAAGISQQEVEMCAYSPQWGDINLEPPGSRQGTTEYGFDLQLSKAFQIGEVRLEAVATVINALGTERETRWAEEELQATAVGTPVSWTRPRRYEVGFRVEF
jgi:hypothetical protein